MHDSLGMIYSKSNFVNGDKIWFLLKSNSTCTSIDSTYSDTFIVKMNGTIHPKVYIKSDKYNICKKDSVLFDILNNNYPADSSYLWYVNDVYKETNFGKYKYAFSSTSKVYCKVISSLVCRSIDTVKSNIIEVVIKPTLLPTISISYSPTTITSSTPVVFKANSTLTGVYATYIWYQNHVFKQASMYDTFAIIGLHNNDSIYCVMISDTSCLDSPSITSNVLKIKLSSYIHTVNTKYKILPNPIDDILNIEMQNKTSKSTVIEIYNSNFQMIYKDVISPNSDSHQIDFTRFSNGIYTVHLKNENEIFVERVLKINQ
jgi:hypothetical protein